MSKKKFEKALNRYINDLENELREIETEFDICDIDLFETGVEALESVDDEEFDDYTPILYVPHNIEPEKEDFTERGARRNSKIAKLVAKEKGLIVVDGVHVYAYMPDKGVYRLLNDTKLKIEIEKCIPPEVSEALGTKAMAEIVDKIKRNPELQRERNFNSNPLKINCANGVLDLTDGKACLMMHSPANMFDYSVDANYIYVQERIEAKAFELYCETTFREDAEIKRQLLLEIIGYICSDSMSGKCIMIGIGESHSGKSVLAKFIERLFSKENRSNVEPHDMNSLFERANLYGKKVNVLTELSSTDLKRPNVLKTLSSGDTIMAAFKGRDSFEFENKAKLLCFANAFPMPAEIDPTNAFINRLVVLKFPYGIEKDKQDIYLLDKLSAERDTIFSLAIDAYLELMARNFEFTQPADSKRFLAAYKSDTNSFQLFMQDCLELNSSRKIHSAVLFSEYKNYCISNGLEELDERKVRIQLQAISGVERNKIRNRWGFEGIGLKDDGTFTSTLKAGDSE